MKWASAKPNDPGKAHFGGDVPILRRLLHLPSLCHWGECIALLSVKWEWGFISSCTWYSVCRAKSIVWEWDSFQEEEQFLLNNCCTVEAPMDDTFSWERRINAREKSESLIEAPDVTFPIVKASLCSGFQRQQNLLQLCHTCYAILLICPWRNGVLPW